jgi:rubrerythrin
MVTMVGTESRYTDLIGSLLQLEHDAIAAYDTCIERLESPSARETIAAFRRDHDRHVRELTDLAEADGIEVPAEGSMKQMLTTGKVALAGMVGDGAILKAMASNESDTIAAYERAKDHADAPAAAREIFARAPADEVRHREWMSGTAEAM